ncbi:hypothetical protein F5884DRAFT_182139 [Xylogone sp. PMI_703]|nr:hypothetical protein F5884DRAFT_182139 [Xylogone sp. PMI_703]
MASREAFLLSQTEYLRADLQSVRRDLARLTSDHEILKAKVEAQTETPTSYRRNFRKPNSSNANPSSSNSSNAIPTAPEPDHTMIQSLVAMYHGVPKRELSSILQGSFDPIYLLCLRPNNTLGKKPTISDYINDSLLWEEGFLNYICIMNTAYAAKAPGLMPALVRYHTDIRRLTQEYEWKDVANLALNYHREICRRNPLDRHLWPIPQQLIKRYCRSRIQAHFNQPTSHQETRGLKRKRSDTEHSNQGSSTAEYHGPHSSLDEIPICYAFNTAEGCKSMDCRYDHQCLVSGCESRHSAINHYDSNGLERGFVKIEPSSH